MVSVKGGYCLDKKWRSILKLIQPSFSRVTAITPNFIKTLVGTTRKYGPSIHREKTRQMVY